MKAFMKEMTSEIEKLFSDSMSGIGSREDARAFGAMIEKRVVDQWRGVCANTGSSFVDIPGRKTIYDVACLHEGILHGFDIKTKDMDSGKYSDGGICSVGNLLRFLSNDHAIFVVMEFGHSMSERGKGARDLKYIRAVPFHMLPADCYRIENLGTGQVRLNHGVDEIFNEIDWTTGVEQFFDVFTEVAMKHYEKVGEVAQRRIAAMRRFRRNGYGRFSF